MPLRERQQLGQPLGILHVSLAPGHVLDPLGIADDDGERVLQDRMHWAPVDPGALHPDMGTAGGGQPVAQLQQARGGRGKTTDLATDLLARPSDPQTRHHGRLMDIQTATTLDQGLHSRLPSWATITALSRGTDTPKRALRLRRQHMMIPIDSAGQSAMRGLTAKGGSASSDRQIWYRSTRDRGQAPASPRFSRHDGARGAGWGSAMKMPEVSC